MRTWLFAACAALVISLPSVASAKVRPGDRAAAVSLKDARGHKVRLSRFRGKVVVLTFGASWCKPCGRELPAYEKLSHRYSKKDVVFIAVNIDNDVADGKKFMKKSGLKNVLAVFDPKKSSVSTWDPPTMPSTFVIDRKGIVRHLHKGFEAGDEKDIARILAQLK